MWRNVEEINAVMTANVNKIYEKESKRARNHVDKGIIEHRVSRPCRRRLTPQQNHDQPIVCSWVHERHEVTMDIVKQNKHEHYG